MILRGLWERRTLSLVVLLIAVVPIACAAVGPIYTAAAATTVVRDALMAAPVDGRGWRYTTRTGGIQAKAAALTASFTAAPVYGMEISSGDADLSRELSYTLVWQDGQCERLRPVEGRCPRAAGEVMASRASGMAVGSEVRLAALVRREPGTTELRPAPLKVVGVYGHESAGDPFWFGRSLTTPGGESGSSRIDPLFTVPQTREETAVAGAALTADPAQRGGWTDYAIVTVDAGRVLGSDLGALTALQAAADTAGRETDDIVYSRMPVTLRAMTTSSETLGVPTLLVSAQLVGLAWLLLFQTVGDLVRARGAEIALARLRGHGRARVWRFALAEPLLLLALAVPLGLAAGLLAARAMVEALLPPGIPAVFPAQAAYAGLAATAGGLMAAVVSAWRVATRPVTEEWRRTPRRSARGWVPDAVVLVVTALGLVELLAGGVISDTTGQSSSALAVPGLMALGVALLAARGLPVLARRLFGLTRRRGGLGPFLALRQVARGPVTTGSVIVLGTAFGLATFAVSAWTATSADYRRAAAFHNGAPAAITVQPVGPRAFADAVEAADPGGTAAPVIKVPGPPQLIATDPERLARVATWDPELAGGVRLAEAAAALPGPGTPRVMVSGDRFRLTARHDVPPEGWQVRLFATFRIPDRLKPAAIPLGVLRPAGGGSYAWNLPLSCRDAPCELRRVHAEFTPLDEQATIPRMEVVVTRLELRDEGRWQRVPTPRWRVDGDPDRDDGGFVVSLQNNQTLRPATYDPRPAAVVVGVGAKLVPGLDHAFATGVRAVATASAAPGLTGPGVVMDLEQADRIAYGVHEQAVYQVWTRAAGVPALERALREQGLTVVSTRYESEVAAAFVRQGPGLALVLLLISALAAASLALGRTVLALHTAAKRRGYELAALEASGAKVAALRVALLLEQLITAAAGTLAGLVAGLLAAGAALGRIPQFAEPLVTPPLAHDVAAAPVALLTGAGLLAALLCAVAVSEALLRGIRVERLRDTPA
ncbi:FtsX-like permease family protein [Nonomuraea sp. NPDC049725]|uniref:FtsX-like permease family protein n=1 Tax=Nonomuraea sp. NPDC049725 TaxID=3154508 RepID=UPI00343DB323